MVTKRVLFARLWNAAANKTATMTDVVPFPGSPEEWDGAGRRKANRCPTLLKRKEGGILEAAELDVWLGKNSRIL